MPNLVTELLKFLKTSSDYFNFDQLEILCNYFYEDGTRISANSDINVLLKKSEEKQPIQLKNKKTFKETIYIRRYRRAVLK
jgi:hypothetical protein